MRPQTVASSLISSSPWYPPRKSSRPGTIPCFLLLLLIQTLFTAIPSLAAGEDLWSKRKILLATGEWPPYSSSRLPHGGFFSVIVTEIFREMGWEVELVFLPWKRCELMVQRGEILAAFPYTQTPERDQDYLFSTPLFQSESKFFYYKEKDVPFSSLNDLHSYTIGGTLGHFYEKIFSEAKLNVEYTTSELQNLNKLKKGRVDLVPMDVVAGRYAIQNYFPDDLNNFYTSEKSFAKTTFGLMVSRKHPQAPKLLQEFNQAFQRIIQKGLYHRILEEHMLEFPSELSLNKSKGMAN